MRPTASDCAVAVTKDSAARLSFAEDENASLRHKIRADTHFQYAVSQIGQEPRRILPGRISFLLGSADDLALGGVLILNAGDVEFLAVLLRVLVRGCLR